MSIVVVMPRKAQSKSSCQYCSELKKASIASAKACSISSDCVTINILRFGKRSTTAPAKRVKSSIGRNCATPTSPTRNGESVIV